MTDDLLMSSVLQRIATGPTMSKDLTTDEARAAMRLVLEGRADPVQAGIFLIALRMKRESDEEMAGVLQAITDGMAIEPVSLARLLVLVDPYDGSLRGTPVGAFLPAVLAACGVPTLSHGVVAMGPKFGTTHQQVLAAAGVPVNLARAAARAALGSDGCGWAYLSQAEVAPELAALAELRTRILKRPCLTTIESVLSPFRPAGSLHLATGFVHKAYPDIYARLAQASGFDSALIIRGVEGSVVPSLSQRARIFRVPRKGAFEQVDIDPQAVGVEQAERAVPLPEALQDEVETRSVKPAGNAFASALATHAARHGLAALQGTAGPARDSLVYAAAVMLVGLEPPLALGAAAEKVRDVLDSGQALARFRALSG